MEQGAADAGWAAPAQSRFELAPPRHFLLPAVLLLLSEEPGYGYSLTKGLKELRFGRVDRPSVYRALAQLERDGLVESWPGTPTAGQTRRVYGLTDQGQRALRSWMVVVKQERDCLDTVLRRYMATGTIDAVLAEVEGGWAAVTGHPWSPVSSTSRIERRRARVPARRRARTSGDAAPIRGLDTAPARSRFDVVPERSAVLIEARSTVGPITFGATGVAGSIEARVHDGVVDGDPGPTAHLEIDVASLRSGNGLYDAELLRRIDARRHPSVTLDLHECIAVGRENHYRLAGDATFHGVTRPLQGTVAVTSVGETLVVTGEHVFDIRDFDIASPTVLMLRIYPDVLVQLHVEATRAEPSR
jgi:DNA-binding PadR family transcriptional regulator/polyisoprenoid-binding protein YceI